jgi:hypothetical protein
MQTQSKGIVDPKVLDCTEEQDEIKQKKEINPKLGFGQYRVCKRIKPDGMVEWYLETLDEF